MNFATARARLMTACMLLMMVFVSTPVIAAPIDQSGWAARKQVEHLPNGVDLAWVELGDPAGEPVLLLHGFTDSSRVWTTLAPELARYRLLIPDLRGHGGSSAPECCYAIADLAHDARLFLDARGIGRVTVIGHSLGSMIAQALAADHPDRVDRLVLIGSTALAPVRRGDWLWTNVMRMGEPVASNSEFLAAWSGGASPTPVDRDQVAHLDREAAAVPLRVWRAVARELVDVPVGRLAPDIVAPTLILSGGKDALFDANHHAALVKAIPHAQARVFPALGHNLILETPADLGPAIVRFIGETEAVRSARSR